MDVVHIFPFIFHDYPPNNISNRSTSIQDGGPPVISCFINLINIHQLVRIYHLYPFRVNSTTATELSKSIQRPHPVVFTPNSQVLIQCPPAVDLFEGQSFVAIGANISIRDFEPLPGAVDREPGGKGMLFFWGLAGDIWEQHIGFICYDMLWNFWIQFFFVVFFMFGWSDYGEVVCRKHIRSISVNKL